MVFDKQWFNTHQSKLLWLLNSRLTRRLFRRILSIDCEETINRIESNAYWFGAKKGKGIEVTADFRTHAKYSKRLYYAFKPLWQVMHVWDLFADAFIPRLSFGFDTLTAYPDADPETTTVDGYISHGTGGTANPWATAQGAADGTSVDDSGIILFSGTLEGVGGSGRYGIRRGFMLFDTSSLTNDAVVSAAIFSGWAWNSGFGDNDAQAYTNIYATTPASNTALTTADYDQIGSTDLSTAIRHEDVVANDTVYTDFTLNGTGIAAVSKTGITKLGLREGHDVENSAPANDTNNYVWFYAADQTGTSKDPKLVVTYTLPSSAKFLQLLGIG